LQSGITVGRGRHGDCPPKGAHKVRPYNSPIESKIVDFPMSALKPETKNRKLLIQNPKSKIQNQTVQDRPGYTEAAKAAKYIRVQAGIAPRLGVILGSGLGGIVDSLRQAKRISYQSIPHFPRSTVLGHAGELHVGYWEEVPVAILAGRMHLYEGYSPAQVVLPTRALALAGAKMLLVTCAAGGIAPQATPGSLMVFSDHLNLQGMNPLVGPEDPRLGLRFIDMSVAYDPQLRRAALQAARKQRIRCFEGVYAGLLGPSFETPAEIRALQRLGAGAVGMSTVPEVIAARQLDVRVMAVASITNRAAGLSRQKLSHEEVLEAGRRAADDLIRLIDAVIGC
jgi:purine-nucleoside phosphorylase